MSPSSFRRHRGRRRVDDDEFRRPGHRADSSSRGCATTRARDASRRSRASRRALQDHRALEMSVAATRCRVAPTPSPSVRRPGVRGEPSACRPARDRGVPRDRPRDGVAARFRVKGAPDSPTKEESGWSAPPGVPPAAWSVRMHLLARMVSDGTVGGVAADLGCGHGLLALGLVTGGRVDAAVGIDRSAGSGRRPRERPARPRGDRGRRRRVRPDRASRRRQSRRRRAYAHRGRRRRLPHRRRRRRPNHVRHPRRRATHRRPAGVKSDPTDAPDPEPDRSEVGSRVEPTRAQPAGARRADDPESTFDATTSGSWTTND